MARDQPHSTGTHHEPVHAPALSESHLVEGGLDRRNLGEDVDAVPILIDHALDAADLTLDPRQARLEGDLVVAVSGNGHAPPQTATG